LSEEKNEELNLPLYTEANSLDGMDRYQERKYSHYNALNADLIQDDLESKVLHRRSRSYEALVQLEAILEARHHQLMKLGTLEDLNYGHSVFRNKSNIVMTEIQDEIAQMHNHLSQSQSENTLVHDFSISEYA